MVIVPEPLVVRAEIVDGDRRIVAHTTGVTERSVVVRTHETVTPGAMVKLSLSLGRLMRPIDLDARVVDQIAGAGHGYLPALTLELSPAAAADRFADLVRQLAAPPTLQPCRVLVVEDSEFMRSCIHVAAERLTERGVTVTVDSAETAEDALGLIALHQYDLALVDLYLPGEMDGAQLVRELRVKTPADLPVIGFSIGGAAARTAFLVAGADIFLDKPVMTRDVLATLARLAVLTQGGANG